MAEPRGTIPPAKRPKSVPTPTSEAQKAERKKSIIEEFEGRERMAYKDIAGYWTIGIGHKLTQPEVDSGMVNIGGRQVSWREGLDDDQIDRLLAQDMAQARKIYDKHVKVHLGPNQQEAMLSFFFNTGGQAIGGKTLQALNDGDFPLFLRRFGTWFYSKGKPSPGLANRRTKERALFELDPFDPFRTGKHQVPMDDTLDAT